jgi:tellurite resistance protein TerC
MGLRAMFFVLAGMINEFRYLQAGLSLVLIFIGGKMLLSQYVHISSLAALTVTLALIAGAVLLSVLTANREGRRSRKGE